MIDWTQFTNQESGNTCSDCIFHVWNFIEHRTYCRNPDSHNADTFTMNNDTCDHYERRKSTWAAHY